MRIKTPNTLVSFPRDKGIVLYNYLSKSVISCSTDDLYWILLPAEWTEVDDIINDHADYDAQSLRDEFSKLVEAGMLIEQGSSNDLVEQEYQRTWEMGIAAGIFHFTLLDTEVGSLDDSKRKQTLRMSSDPSPPLYWRNSRNAVPLPREFSPATQGLMPTLYKRRSVRCATPEPIALADLSAILFAGLGLTGFVKTDIQWLPLKLTPSGGARNPYEAFVLVQNVDGLEPGVHHYSAYDHSLEKISDTPEETAGQLLNNQEWANDMAAVVFLVAILERTMWKYNDPNSYRVMIMEAGHIGQNMMLASAANNLTACPTGALAHSMISRALQLKAMTHTPVYAISIGHPADMTEQIVSVEDSALMGIAG